MRIVKIYFYEYFTILSKNVLKYMNIRILLLGGLVCFFGACNNNVKQTKQETILFEPLSVDGLIIGQAYGILGLIIFIICKDNMVFMIAVYGVARILISRTKDWC